MGAQITPADAGCWLDGSQGWHNTYRVCERAMSYGWLEDDPSDREAVNRLIEEFKSDDTGNDAGQVMSEAADDATDYLNSLAPEGYIFVWDAGELSLMTEDEAGEFGHFG